MPNTLSDLNEEMQEKFEEIGAKNVFRQLKLQNTEEFHKEIARFTGDEKALLNLINQYKKARKAHKETERESWESIIAKFDDSNTDKTEARNYLAKFIEKRRHFKTPKSTEQLWVFQNPVYEPNGEQVIRTELNNELGNYMTSHDIEEVIDKVKSRTFCERRKQKAPPKFIPVENGWYNIETGELEEPRPKYFAVNHIPVEYDEDAEPERFKEFLEEIIHESDIPLIQEMFGYTLYRDYPIARAFMLLGSGGNGKSTLLNILKEFIGQQNVANPSLQKLGQDRFASAQLYGKLANIHADLSSKTLENTGTFKMLTGGDLIHGERKFQDPFQFENYAKLLYSANELPGTKDTTDAFFRRWIVIRFPYKFTSNPDDGNKDKDPDILDDVLSDSEMSGIFNWAVEGLKRVLDNNEFSQTKGREAVKDEWLLNTQPMQVFFEKGVKEEAGVGVGKDELYSDYSEFCREIGVTSKNRSVFFKELYSEFPQASESRVRDGNQRKQRLLGITTREVEQVVKVVKANTNPSRNAHAHTHKGVGSTPDHRDQVLEFIKENEYEGDVPIEDIKEAVEIGDEDLEELLQDLEEEGDIYSPKPGFYKVL